MPTTALLLIPDERTLQTEELSFSEMREGARKWGEAEWMVDGVRSLLTYSSQGSFPLNNAMLHLGNTRVWQKGKDCVQRKCRCEEKTGQPKPSVVHKSVRGV